MSEALSGDEPAPRHHRLRAALFERRIVEKGVGLGREHFERERRGLRQIAGDHLDLARFDAPEHALEAGNVHRFMQQSAMA